jgi:hypothetical protein
MSHPFDYFEGSKAYQSLIPRCIHSVMRVFQDPQGKSSACDICNSDKLCRPLGQKQIKKKVSKEVESNLTRQNRTGVF